MVREDIEFSAQGATLRGWFYPADTPDDTAPCIVLSHGFSAVKEMGLDHYAEVFQAAGLSCLVYDHPGFGASDALPGTPRQEIDPWQQIRCTQHAITYAQSRSEVDAEKIGLWGTSYSASHALVVAATDHRVKAVVTQVPSISGTASFTSQIRIDHWAPTDAAFAGERLARFNGAEPTMMPVVNPDPTGHAAMGHRDSYEWFSANSELAPTWRNELTVQTVEFVRGYDVAGWIPQISPTPLLMIVAPHDRVTEGQIALAAYETALQPKKLVLLSGGHFDSYSGANFDTTSQSARDWFLEHLATVN